MNVTTRPLYSHHLQFEAAAHVAKVGASAALSNSSACLPGVTHCHHSTRVQLKTAIKMSNMCEELPRKL